MLIIKIKELRAMQDNVLKSKRNELMLELFAERRKIVATGVQSKVVKIREIKRNIARINTVFRERGVKG
ncbi:MAG: 50S ribosomal protein L29 [Candidatus Micrarchaeaceae archaeon]